MNLAINPVEYGEIHVVRGAVLDDANRILLVRRRLDSKNDGGKWELPGGQVENGEDETQAVMREFKEETGLDIIPVSPFYTAERRKLHETHRNGLYLVRCAVGQYMDGELSLAGSDEAMDARWLDYQSALQLPDLTRASRNGLNLLGRHALQHISV